MIFASLLLAFFLLGYGDEVWNWIGIDQTDYGLVVSGLSIGAAVVFVTFFIASLVASSFGLHSRRISATIGFILLVKCTMFAFVAIIRIACKQKICVTCMMRI
jgi:hypothetical protein